MTPSADLPKLTAAHALFLDFDGTLAPIQDDPDAVKLPEDTRLAMTHLQAVVGEAIVVISGRDVRDLSARIPQTYWRAGGHGLEICAPGAPPAEQASIAPPELSKAIDAITHGLSGVRVEHKGEVIAIHFRRAPRLEDTLLARLTDSLREIEGYKAQLGKMVLEAKPVHANKGRAIETMMGHAPFTGRLPVMVGDDTTDEDAFETVNRLGGFAIKVGDGATAAGYRVPAPQDVAEWMKQQEPA